MTKINLPSKIVDIRRRGGFFQRRAEGKEQVYGGQDLVLGALESGQKLKLTSEYVMASTLNSYSPDQGTRHNCSL